MKPKARLRFRRARLVAAAAVIALVVPATGAGSPNEPVAPRGEVQILVKPRERAARDGDEVLAAAGGVTTRRISALAVRVVRVRRAHVSETIAALEASGDVAYAEVDEPLVRVAWNLPSQRERLLELFGPTPNDAAWPAQWSLLKANVPAAWAATTGSRKTVVAVLDSGVDASQPDLQGALVPGWDFANGDPDTSDDLGHGTMVAGVIAARANNRVGIAGTCWRCSIMPVKVVGADGLGTHAGVAAGIVWAADRGADVLNLSLGSSLDSVTLADAVRYAQARGAIVVAGAGNSAGAAPFYPAAYPGVLGVAASDRDDRRYDWSSFGSWVSLAAPGCSETTLAGGSFGSFCGTSAAAPVVAGVDAFACSYAPAAPPAEIARVIETTAVRVGDAVRNGRVDAGRTLAELGATRARVGRAGGSHATTRRTPAGRR